MDITSNAPFARHRLPESYFWILGVCFEPQYAYVRSTMTKMISIAIVLDDLYDAYGILEELEIVTDMIERFVESSYPHICTIWNSNIGLYMKINLVIYLV